MKETINANIGSQAFTLDKDAYERLANYFADVRSRLADNDTETMDDIEARFAEIFNESRSSSLMVVTLRIVEQAIARMGRPDDFGPARHNATRNDATNVNDGDASLRRIRRSRTNRSIAGICGGLGKYFGVDPTLLRLITLLLILFGGLSIWIYIVLWIIIPEETIPVTNTKNI
ncbi:MAG: PspC domain-containing protein [Alistipes sp.]